MEIDAHCHSQAVVCIAKKVELDGDRDMAGFNGKALAYYCSQRRIANYWEFWIRSLKEFVRNQKGSVVIVGAGVIGAFAHAIINPGKVFCFIDSNDFKQKKGWCGSEVISPMAFPRICGASPNEFCYVLALSYEQSVELASSLLPEEVISQSVFYPPPFEA
jgi:hypothetical protein